MVSGETQPAHLTPPPFSYSPRSDPWNQGRTRIFSLFPLVGQANKRLAPQSERKGVGSVCYSFSYFFFFLRLRNLLRGEGINWSNFLCVRLKVKSCGWLGSSRFLPGPHQEKHFTGDVCVVHADRIVCMSCGQNLPVPSIPFLTPQKEKKSSESVYIPEMPG